MIWLVGVLLGSLALVSIGWWRERTRRKAAEALHLRVEDGWKRQERDFAVITDQRNEAVDRWEKLRQAFFPIQK